MSGSTVLHHRSQILRPRHPLLITMYGEAEGMLLLSEESGQTITPREKIGISNLPDQVPHPDAHLFCELWQQIQKKTLLNHRLPATCSNGPLYPCDRGCIHVLTEFRTACSGCRLFFQSYGRTPITFELSPHALTVLRHPRSLANHRVAKSRWQRRCWGSQWSAKRLRLTHYSSSLVLDYSLLRLKYSSQPVRCHSHSHAARSIGAVPGVPVTHDNR